MSQHALVTLSSEQRDHLSGLTRSGNAPARVQTRARILLLADRSPNNPGGRQTYPQIAPALQVCVPTISVTCRRFVFEGMEAALSEKPRPGQTPKITGDVEVNLRADC